MTLIPKNRNNTVAMRANLKPREVGLLEQAAIGVRGWLLCCEPYLGDTEVN